MEKKFYTPKFRVLHVVALFFFTGEGTRNRGGGGAAPSFFSTAETEPSFFSTAAAEP
jgi:hypothetical protein